MIQGASAASAFFGLDRFAQFSAQASRKEALSVPIGATSRNREASAVGKTADGKTGKAAGSAENAELTPDQQREVQKLKQRDQEVHRHEQAHIAAGGSLIRGAPSYTYQTGPDKRRYAIGGEVSIDTTPAKTPEETIPKAQHIRATALAPADPSPQDRSVAAKATQMEGDAHIEIARNEREEAAQEREAELLEEEEKAAEEEKTVEDVSRNESDDPAPETDEGGKSAAAGAVGFYQNQNADPALSVGLRLDSYA
jgi:hypothetical protein